MMAYIFHLKKAFLLLLLFAASLGVYAQEEREFKKMLGVSPVNALTLYGLDIKYERSLSGYPRRTFGAFLMLYSGAYSDQGIQIEPFIRYYHSKAPEGFYFQMKLIGGIYSNGTFLFNLEDRYQREYKTQTYMGCGLGFVGGHQFELNGGWTLDINFGLRILGTNKKYGNGYGNGYEEEGYLNSSSPTCLIDGLFSFGHRF